MKFIKSKFVLSGFFLICMFATIGAASAQTFTVNFLDYNSTVLDTQSVASGADATAPADPSRTGYTFTDWNPSDLTNITADTDFTAQYSMNQYTMTFDTDGGTAVAPITEYYNITIIPPTHPTKSGYVFNGWSPAIPTTMPAINETHTAQWVLPGAGSSQFAGGSGTVDNPYKIQNCTHFQNINDWSSPASGLVYFLLENTIYCTSIGDDVMIGGKAEDAIAAQLYFDGGGNTIEYDITLGAMKGVPTNVGLFRLLNRSTIENLNVAGSIVSHNRVGGVVGRLNDSVMNNVSSTASVEGNQSVGGVIGYLNKSEVDDISFVGTVSGGGNYVGGLIGEANIADIYNSHTSGTVSSVADYVGGMVGGGTETYIYSSYNMSTVSGNDNIGGLLGFTISLGFYVPNRGILDSYNAGDVTGNDRVGGLIGSSNAQSNLQNCYNIGDISGSSEVGGIVGYNGSYSVIENCYNAGVVNGGNIVGGLFGNPGSFQNVYSFWDILDGNNPTGGDIGSGLDTDTMKNLNTYLDAERDIAGIPDSSYNNGYPFLGREQGLSGNMRYISTTLGCIDPEANNFDPLATQDDASCTYIQAVQPSKGGGGAAVSIDNCPNGDFSGSYYDNDCGIQEQHETKDKQDNTTIDNHTQKDSSVSDDKNPLDDTCIKNDEYNIAYDFAYKYNITTQKCDEIDMNAILIRSHSAKMMSNYAINFLDMQSDTNKVCEFDDMGDETQEMQNYAIIACQLGLMGLAGDGKTPLQSFNPQGMLDKAQLATILSRMMYGAEYDNNQEDFWAGHVQAMQDAGIITVTTDLFDPLRKAYAMIMLMRTAAK